MEEDVLLPYQKDWINDNAPVKIWEKSRRIGASYAEALASVLSASKDKAAGGMNTYYTSYNKEMTQQFIKDCSFWAKNINVAAGEIEEVAIKNEDQDITVYRIRFASGYEIWGLPSEPRSLRSKQGRVVIDEAAFCEDLGELLKAAMALLMWGGQVSILSTHNGDDNPFYRLVKDIKENKKNYSLHRITIDDAISDGLYRRICLVGKKPWSVELQIAWRDELFQTYGEETDEELLCIPSRSGSRYFPRELLEKNTKQAPVLRLNLNDDFIYEPESQRELKIQTWFDQELKGVLTDCQNSVYLGEDFARSGDLTVIWLLRLINDQLETLAVVEIKNVPFTQQWQLIKLITNTLKNFSGGAYDARGNGQMIAELASQEWPGFINQVMLTRAWYATNFPKLKSRLENSTLDIPSDPLLIEDFSNIGLKQGIPQVLERTGWGNNKRHGDSAIAACLAVFAAIEDEGTNYSPYSYQPIEQLNLFRERKDDQWD